MERLQRRIENIEKNIRKLGVEDKKTTMVNYKWHKQKSGRSNPKVTE